MTDTFDVAVLGGGPAGCLTAIQLLAQNHRVAIINKGRPAPTHEGVADRVLDILAAHSCASALAALGPHVERIASWNGETAARNRETVVDRQAFDRGLLADARSYGATVLDGRVGRTERHDNGELVTYRDADGEVSSLVCRYVVEARGRRAPARRGRVHRGPETTALTRRMRNLMPVARTVVAGFPDGWLWFVSPGDGVGHLQLFVDSAPGALPKRAALTEFFERHVAALDLAAGLLLEGNFVGPVSTRSASSWLARGLISERGIRVGDAAVAVDPLSGHGIFEAVGSALAAGAAIHTILNDADAMPIARDFYTERATESFFRYCRVGRDFYALESRWAKRPFWHRRAVWPDSEPAHGGLWSAPPKIVAKPVVENGLVVRREVCVTADHPRGVWRLAEVPVVDLVRLLATGAEPDSRAIVPIAAAHFGVEPAQVETAMSWLRYRGIISKTEPIEVRIGLP